MAFNLMAGETVLHRLSGNHKVTNYTFMVANRRIIDEETRWGSGATTILPLDRIDSMQEDRVSSPRWLIVAAVLMLASLAGAQYGGAWSLLGVIPALICAGIWWLSLKQALVFATASAQVSLVMRGYGGGQEVLELVEPARQDYIREVIGLQAPAAPAPPTPAHGAVAGVTGAWRRRLPGLAR